MRPAHQSSKEGLWQGPPLELFEYMAREKPFVSTKLDPTLGKPSAGEAGVLVEPGRAEDFAEAAVQVVQDSGIPGRTGLQGGRLVEKGFPWLPLKERISSMVQEA
jgi:hypothetical protein